MKKEEVLEILIETLTKNGANSISIFGSYARGEEGLNL